jgi:hypothetical protein
MQNVKRDIVYMPLLWEPLYNFARLIGLACKVTFGPPPPHKTKQVSDSKSGFPGLKVVRIND